MKQKVVTSSVTLNDIDLIDTIIKCTSATPITLTFPTAAAVYTFADSIIVNYGAGTVTANSTAIKQNYFGQISCDGGTSWHVAVGSNLELGETSTTAYAGDKGKTAYDHSQTAHAPSDAQKNSDIIKSEIEAVLTGELTSHTHASLVTKANVEAVLTGEISSHSHALTLQGITLITGLCSETYEHLTAAASEYLLAEVLI
jgi:hypothetical protein